MGSSITAEGRHLARGWCWPFAVSELECGLLRLTLALSHGDFMRHNNAELVPETFIAGADWGEQIALLQCLFMPLLTDGVLIGRTTYGGRAYYGIGPNTPESLLSVASEIIDCNIEFNPTLSDLYTTEFVRSRRRILADGEYYSEIGEIPLVVMALESGRAYDDLENIESLFQPLVGTTNEDEK